MTKQYDQWTETNFALFWIAYPRKVAKLAAKKAYAAAMKIADPFQIMAGVERYAFHTRNTEHQYIKHPASWLNAGCWEDELTDTRQIAPKTVGSVFGNLAAQMESGNGVVRRLQGDEGIREAFPLLSFASDEPQRS